MIVSLKHDVRVRGISPEILLAIVIAENVYANNAQDFMVITSLTDGKHGAASLHYTGEAVDLRLPTPLVKEQIIKQLKSALGSSYDVVLESDHIHIEHDPKR